MARLFVVGALGALACIGACGPRGLDGSSSSGESGGDGNPYHGVADAGVGHDGGGWKSDGGATCGWTPYNDGLVGGYVTFVLYDPRAPGVAWAASGDHLYRSGDHGQTWSFVSEAPASVNQIALPVDSKQHVLLATTSGVAASTDGGTTWTRTLDGIDVPSILAHPADALRVYVGTNGAGILRSDDGAKTFYPVNEGAPYATYFWLDGDPTNVDTVLAAAANLDATGNYSTSGEVLRTTTGGAWTSTSGSFLVPYNFARCPAAPQTVYASSASGLLVSKDGGQSWSSVVSEFEDGNVAVAASDCNTVYRVVESNGMFRSTDGAATFVGPLKQGIPFANAFPREVSVDPSDPSRLLGTTPGGLLYSADGGEHWSLVGGTMGLVVTGLATSPTAPDRLWLSTWGAQGFVRNGAAPWARAPLAVDYQFTVAPDPSVADRTFFGTWSDPFVTLDGTTFTSADVPTNPMAFAFDPNDSKTVYMATEIGGIDVSTDGGKSWSPSSADIPPWADGNGTYVDVRTLFVDATTPHRVLAGAYENGLWISEDGAATWTQASTFPKFNWAQLVQLTTGTPALFASVGGHGVQTSTDGGGTWKEVSSGLPTEDLTGLVADPKAGVLYASTIYGVFASKDRGASWQGVDLACSPSNGFGLETIVTTTSGPQLAAVAGGGFGVYVHPLL